MLRYEVYFLYDADNSPYELIGIDGKWSREDIQYDIDVFTEEAIKLGKEFHELEDYVIERLLGHYGDDAILFGWNSDYNVLHINI